jgi:uncharacterized protein
MGTLLRFAALSVMALVLAAVLSPWVFFAIHPHFDYPLHRVYNRTAILLLLAFTYFMLSRWRLRDRVSLGYGLPWKPLFTRIGVGFVVGALLLLPVLIWLIAAGIRVWKPEAATDGAVWIDWVLDALVTGLAVALIEETFFRGAMFTAAARASGTTAAINATALLYAAIHFLGEKARVPADSVDWLSGWTMLRHFAGAYADPASLIDSFLALFAVGVLLARVRAATGHIGWCIGMHAGFVAVISLLRSRTTHVTDTAQAAWVGSFDGVVGWGVLLWTVILLAASWRWLTPRPAANGLPAAARIERAVNTST